MILYSKAASETIRVGKIIGSCLQPGDVVALTGGLGAGKTQLVKGLAQGAGVAKTAYVSSPSFTLINEYHGGIPFYHIDLYRLEVEKEAIELGLEEYFHGEGVTAVEWAERIPSLLPDECLRIHIHYTGKNTRSIEIAAKGNRYEQLIKEIKARASGLKHKATSKNIIPAPHHVRGKLQQESRIFRFWIPVFTGMTKAEIISRSAFGNLHSAIGRGGSEWHWWFKSTAEHRWAISIESRTWPGESSERGTMAIGWWSSFLQCLAKQTG